MDGIFGGGWWGGGLLGFGIGGGGGGGGGGGRDVFWIMEKGDCVVDLFLGRGEGVRQWFVSLEGEDVHVRW